MVREDLGRLLAAAALSVPVNQAFFLNGTRLAPTTHVALIYAACPLVVLALASALGQERLTRDRLVGVLASVAGVAVIGLDSLRGAGPESAAALRGDLLIVGAVLSWGVYLTLNKPLVARHGALPALAGTFLLGALLNLPITAWTWPGLAPLASAPTNAWVALVYLVVVVSAFGLACMNQALRRLDASQVATASNAAPILTVAWGALLLGESVTPALVLGGALTLGGIAWASRPGARSSAARAVEPIRPAVAAAGGLEGCRR
jgi:drug/metabolite transporter (DMT)-like permease